MNLSPPVKRALAYTYATGRRMPYTHFDTKWAVSENCSYDERKPWIFIVNADVVPLLEDEPFYRAAEYAKANGFTVAHRQPKRPQYIEFVNDNFDRLTIWRSGRAILEPHRSKWNERKEFEV